MTIQVVCFLNRVAYNRGDDNDGVVSRHGDVLSSMLISLFSVNCCDNLVVVHAYTNIQKGDCGVRIWMGE